MCLCIDEKQTKKVVDNLSKKGYIIGWKVIKIEIEYELYESDGSRIIAGYKMRTPYMCSIIEITKDGAFVSDRKQAKLFKYETEKNTVDKGIHIFLRKSNAAKIRGSYEYLVPVICKKEDFVAAGKFCGMDSAVFTKIFIDDKDIKKAVSLAKRKARREFNER